jgi:hypothetical protein
MSLWGQDRHVGSQHLPCIYPPVRELNTELRHVEMYQELTVPKGGAELCQKGSVGILPR